MKHKVPQSDLPVIGSEAFNLFGEVAVDGERVQQERKAADKQRLEADEIEKNQQPKLI